MGHETGLGRKPGDIRARLGRILGREVEQDQAERESGASEPGYEKRSIRDRLQAVPVQDRQVGLKKPGRVHDP